MRGIRRSKLLTDDSRAAACANVLSPEIRSVIALRGLRKDYRTERGPVAAVDGLDLEMKESEFCVLLGSSGCGKTTTLRCIAGLEEPDAGDIELGGELVYSASRGVYLPPERRDI